MKRIYVSLLDRFLAMLTLVSSRGQSFSQAGPAMGTRDSLFSPRSLVMSPMTWRYAEKRSSDLSRPSRRSRTWMTPLPEQTSKYTQPAWIINYSWFSHLQKLLWTGCCSFLWKSRQGNVCQQLPEGRDCLGQYIQHILRCRALRRLQGVRHWPWAWPVWPGKLHRGQDCHHGNPQEEQLNWLIFLHFHWKCINISEWRQLIIHLTRIRLNQEFLKGIFFEWI